MPKRKPKNPYLAPRSVRSGGWFYIGPKHLEVYGKASGRVILPWAQVMRAAEHCGRWDAVQGLWIPRKVTP